MLHFVTAGELSGNARLQDSMYGDRRRQFRDRLGWDVQVDAQGWERDEYDFVNPLYVIWERPDGAHGGSLRFLPTTGRTMVNDHFTGLMEGRRVRDDATWECTRFCVAEGAGPEMSTLLLLGAAQVGSAYGLRNAVGVFDMRMVRVYRQLGWSPEILGCGFDGANRIAVGLWAFSEAIRDSLAQKAELNPGQVGDWLQRRETHHKKWRKWTSSSASECSSDEPADSQTTQQQEETQSPRRLTRRITQVHACAPQIQE